MPQPAELVWTRYNKESGAKHFLLVYLGEHDNNTVALLADEVPNHEINALRAGLGRIRSFDLRRIGEYIKAEMPISYGKAYRHFKTDKLSILSSYGLQPLLTKKEHEQKKENSLKLPPEA